MTRLISFHCDDVPQLGRIGLQRCAEPSGVLCDATLAEDGKVTRIGWTVSLRGAAVFIISPPGWSKGVPASQWVKDGTRRAFEVPRSSCRFEWEIEDAKSIDKDCQRFDTEPMVRKVAAMDPVSVNLKDVGDA